MTQTTLKSKLHYNPQTGIFTWIDLYIGIAGSKNSQGYLCIKIDGKLYKAHRLAWLYVYGVFPKDQLDHINRIKDDNRISNLREVDCAENQKNKPMYKTNTSGTTGVYWGGWNWRARIGNKNLGSFKNIEDAIKTRQEAELEFSYKM